MTAYENSRTCIESGPASSLLPTPPFFLFPFLVSSSSWQSDRSSRAMLPNSYGVKQMLLFLSRRPPFPLFPFSEKKESLMLSHVWLFATPWTIQSMEFSRPEHWSGQTFPFPGDLPNTGNFFFFLIFFEYLSNSVLSFRHHQGQGLLEAFIDTQRHLSDTLG